MITVLTGENSFELTRALERIVSEFDGKVEQCDGAALEARHLPDLLMGSTLFASQRLIVVKGLSENKAIWNELGDWLTRISDDIHLVLVDAKLDKRTKTYKDLKKHATIQEFAPWTERDGVKAEAWAKHEADNMKMQLDRQSLQTLVRRTGPDQWAIYHALQKLSVLDQITPKIVEDIVEAAPEENIFSLFDAALRGEGERVRQIAVSLEQTDDPYMVFGLLASQAFQLAAAGLAEAGADVAKDIGAHPFVLQKLVPHARHLGKSGIHAVIEICAQADDQLKSTPADPWLIIDQALTKITMQAHN